MKVCFLEFEMLMSLCLGMFNMLGPQAAQLEQHPQQLERKDSQLARRRGADVNVPFTFCFIRRVI